MGGACRRGLAAALLLLAGAAPVPAALLRVPEDHASIAAAFAAASYGDTVSLAAGIYFESALIWPQGCALLGRTGDPADVVIDAQYQGHVLGGSNLFGENELAYLTLRAGQGAGPYGSGLSAIGDPYLHDLVIEDCTAKGPLYGIGLYARGSAVIVDCVLRNNRSSAAGTEGGGAWLRGTPAAGGHWVENLEVYGNEAAFSSGIHFSDLYGYFTGLYCHDNLGDGLVIYNGSVNGIGPTVEYSFFIGNTGAAIAYEADALIRSCTIVGNGTLGGGAAAVHGGSSWDFTNEPRITQCVVAFNLGPGIQGIALTPYTVDCNDVYENAGGNYLVWPDLTGSDGNISLDPQFCGGGGRPYELRWDSPCAEPNNGCGLLIGAYAVGCADSGVADTHWGAVKARYGNGTPP
ncbi:hypothetical protein FJ251_11910 [bacterium]|nr:hypothetical protein [bacterium]